MYIDWQCSGLPSDLVSWHHATPRMFLPTKSINITMKINQKKKMKNTEILSAGSKVYAKKRKAKKETVESVEFDDASRT